MSRLQPDYYIPHITGVTLEFLRRHGIRGLILDVDNTLTTHDDPTPHPDIAAWLDGMRQAGVGMMIVSNNTEERVRPFAEILGLPYVADGKKFYPARASVRGGQRKSSAACARKRQR